MNVCNIVSILKLQKLYTYFQLCGTVECHNIHCIVLQAYESVFPRFIYIEQ